MTRQAKVVIKSAVADVVREMVDNNRLNKSQDQIAVEIGFKASNVLSMIKQGRTRMPLDKVGPLAAACGYQPDKLVRAALREYMPEFAKALSQVNKMPIFEGAEDLISVVNDAVSEAVTEAQKSHSEAAATEVGRQEATRLNATLDLDDQNKRKLKKFVKENLVQIRSGDDIVSRIAEAQKD